MSREKLTEMGFVNLPKSHDTDIAHEMHKQIDSDPDIADAVLDELIDWNAPHFVCEDNHEEVLDAWVEETAYSLYCEI